MEARLPFLHAFDGFRTSHEVQKIEELPDDVIKSMVTNELVQAHRQRALSPDHPRMRGTAQNPDVFFQAREAANSFYTAVPEIVQKVMDRFAVLAGRQYHLFDYVGAPDAERVIVMMGSGAETAQETVEHLLAKGEKVGLLKVHLFRPFSIAHFLKALPATTRAISCLDRTKEPGAIGEPLYQDVVTALSEGKAGGLSNLVDKVRVTGGRYGLSSKEFTPAMVKAVYDEMAKPQPKNHFTIGINDDVTHTSLTYDPSFDTEPDDVVRAVFWGLGADGTVGANKNSIKIIGEETPNYAQGYFVYDSKKSGTRTVSHLRFGPRPIRSAYLINQARFVGVHQFGFLERFPVLDNAAKGATMLLNSPYPQEETWSNIPRPVQQQIIDKKLKVYGINAYKVAEDTGMGTRVNTIMQTCFFFLGNVVPRDEAIAHIKKAIQDTYGKRGEAVVQKNYAAVDASIDNLYEIDVPAKATSSISMPLVVPAEAPEFIQKVTATIIADKGDTLPVSAMPIDGTFPTGTTRWEKRNIALDVPVWQPDICIQCGRCILFCPHAVIRSKIVDESDLANAPAGFKSAKSSWREETLKGKKYTLQVAVEDCTGCAVCVELCPAKDKTNVGRKAINMESQLPIREQERKNWDFFTDPEG